MRVWYRFGSTAAILALTAAVVMAEEDGKKARSGPKVGDAAPAFDLKATDGKSYKLADLKDKTIVLEWINRECPVCKKQAPQMKATAEALQAKGVIWLAIDSTAAHGLTDNSEHVKADKLPYPILDDHEGTVGKSYSAAHTPTMYVIHKGKVAYVGSLIPAKGDERNYVKDAAEALLAGKEPPLAETDAYGCSVKYKK